MAKVVHYIDLPPPPWNTTKILTIKCQYSSVYIGYSYIQGVVEYLISPFIDEVTCRNCLKKLIKEQEQSDNDSV